MRKNLNSSHDLNAYQIPGMTFIGNAGSLYFYGS